MSARPEREALISTAHGTHAGAFGPTEWALLAAVGGIWGSSFVFIAVGLETFKPELITLLRVVLGTATLALVPRARRPVARQDWGRIAILGAVWMAIPLTLYPIAQQWIDSSLAGMINGSVPLFAAMAAAILLRRLPGRIQMWGLGLGFLGVLAVTWPAAQGARATAMGAGLGIAACVCYGISANLAVPLQQRYGALPVLLRAQLVAVVLCLPLGIPALRASHWAWQGAAAMLVLGVFGTGWAYVAMGTLVGRAGATRGAVAVYFIPVVAIVLGVVFRGERIAPISIVGTGLVLLGAAFSSRREVRVNR